MFWGVPWRVFLEQISILINIPRKVYPPSPTQSHEWNMTQNWKRINFLFLLELGHPSSGSWDIWVTGAWVWGLHHWLSCILRLKMVDGRASIITWEIPIIIYKSIYLSIQPSIFHIFTIPPLQLFIYLYLIYLPFSHPSILLSIMHFSIHLFNYLSTQWSVLYLCPLHFFWVST